MALHDILLRVFLALVLGSMIGYERQSSHKNAGTRTYSLVCIGACVASIMSLLLLNDYQNISNLDPARIPAQILSGIGFLGAGAIIKNKGNITGLTTAAGLWVVATAGMAIGYGYYYLTFVTWFALLVVLYLMRLLEHHFKKYKSYCLSITLNHDSDTLPSILNLLNSKDIDIENIDIDILNTENRLVDIYVFVKKTVDIAHVCNDISLISSNVKSVAYY